MTADVVHLADCCEPAAAAPAVALGAGNAATAAVMLVAACRTLAVSLAQISKSCSMVRDRMNQLHDGAQATAASAAEVIAAAQSLAGLGHSLSGADHA